MKQVRSSKYQLSSCRLDSHSQCSSDREEEEVVWLMQVRPSMYQLYSMYQLSDNAK